MTFILDTSVCIPLINRTEKRLAERLLDEAPSSVILCSVVKAELYFGARNSMKVAENLERVDRFCGVFESLPFDDAAAVHYGSVRESSAASLRPSFARACRAKTSSSVFRTGADVTSTAISCHVSSSWTVSTSSPFQSSCTG